MKLGQNLWIVFFVIVILAMYTAYQVNRPQPMDWSTNFSVKKKSPYGTYIIKDALPRIFPGGKVTISHKYLQERLRLKKDYHPEAYFFVNTHFGMTEDELSALTAYVKEGNTLFVSAEFMQDALLSIGGAKSMQYAMNGKDYIRNFEDKAYPFRGKHWFFELAPSFKGDVLGYVNGTHQPDFIRVPHGKGMVYLHANPMAFTNFYILDSLNGDYYQRALSFLPSDVNVVWDEYQKSDQTRGDFSLRVILQYPALKWAYYLLLSGGLLYLLFRSRREQRPIPMIEPPGNRTLEFVSVVSSLYYKHRNHLAIANKRIDYFLGEIRYYYKLRTDELNEDFIQLLSGRSGVPAESVSRLVGLIGSIREKEHVDEAQLRELVKYIELFKPNK